MQSGYGGMEIRRRRYGERLFHNGGNPEAFFPNENNKPVGKSLWTGILKSSSSVVQNSVL